MDINQVQQLAKDGIIKELVRQRNEAYDRLAGAAGDALVLSSQLKDANAKIEELTQKSVKKKA